VFDDYGEGMESDMNSTSGDSCEGDMDVTPSGTEFEADVSAEMIEDAQEMEDFPQESESMMELQDVEGQVEDKFEDRINSMTLADLKEERERLLEMGAMNGDEIAEQYAGAWEKQGDQDATDRFLSNFDKEGLTQLRQAIVDTGNGSGESAEGTDDTDDEPPQLKLTMKRRSY